MASRTKNSIINSSVSIITQVLTVIINFIVKTVFIKVLGSEYLGLNGLFSNIITMLSLADLGIGIAIPYSLYKPLADKDEKKIRILMKYYSKIYNVIGVIVLSIGLALIPFLPLIIKDMPDIPNISLIYALFVIHSASSYFFVYKKLLIDSDQKSYITSKIIFTFSTVLSIIQVIILLLTKNYILFLLSSIITVVLQNIYICYKADKMYPYIKIKEKDKLSKEEYKEIKRNISSLFIYKVGSVVSNGTDNIVISKIIGLVAVGIYSNYLLIINSITNILNQIFNAITSSIGNLVVTSNKERSKEVYENLSFANFVIYGFTSIGIFVLINPFIKIWIGEEYLLSPFVAFLLSFNLYIGGMNSVTTSFRNAYGLFYKAKYRPIFMCILNLVVSIILAFPLGIAGVVIGTIVSRIFTIVWLDPYVIYKYGFNESPKKYYFKYIEYLLIYLLLSILLYFVFNLVPIANIFLFILVGILLTISVIGFIIIVYNKSSEYKYLKGRMKPFVTKFLK